ncbi:alpha/beta-hydrolase [Coprinopsis sp. MPI-PUGE-AT-0042]|nr:alpha/beta-hydrolase [Coprinopsis sp. MPI-PUGE-AT-0042]
MAPTGPAPDPPATDGSSLPTAFPAATCLRRGLCPVSSLRPQGSELLESHSLYYEQHAPPGITNDTAKFKVVFIMGLNSSAFAWGPQVSHFTREPPNQGPGPATILVFDNRGVGNSGYPRGPYTTSGMAEDAICLLDYIGWTNDREVHVVGISLGGMIAQELAYRIPHRIASLTLAVTTPGGHVWQNFPPVSGLKSLTRLMFTPEPEDKVPYVMNMLHPKSWLEEKDEDDPEGRTNYDVQKAEFLRRISITTPQLFLGHVSQMAAALTHYVSPSRLSTISQQIPKVAIVTGDTDTLVNPQHSFDIKKSMPEAEFIQWKDTGHGIHHHRAKLFNALLERTWVEGAKRVEEQER